MRKKAVFLHIPKLYTKHITLVSTAHNIRAIKVIKRFSSKGGIQSTKSIR